MEVTRLSELRPRGVWDLADDAFDLYRERFALLASLSAVPFVPAHLLNTLLTTLAFERMQRASGTANSTEVFIPLLIYLGASAAGQPILLTAQALQTGLTAVAIEKRLRGESPQGRDIWRAVLPRLLPVLWAGLLAAFFLLVAYTVTCGVGLWLALPLVCFLPACQLLERRGTSDAWRRAWRLGSGGYGKTLGLTMLVSALEGGLLIGLAALLQGMLVLIPGFGGENKNTAQFVSGQAAQAVGSLFLAPLRGVAVTLLYFDGRVRTEGLDLEELAKETGVALAESPR